MGSSGFLAVVFLGGGGGGRGVARLSSWPSSSSRVDLLSAGLAGSTLFGAFLERVFPPRGIL